MTPTTKPDWKIWSERATAAAARCDEIPERGEEFATSVQDRLDKIIETVERTRNVTPDQKRAIENMEGGIAKWLRD